MKRTAIVFLAALAIAACGPKKGAELSSGSKLQYRAEDNKVTVVTLERTEFPAQILSNGKLSAARKASLAFRSSGTIASVKYVSGAKIAKGAVIASLDRPDIKLALESARIALDRAELDLKDRLAGLGYPASDTAAIPAEVLAMAKMRSGYDAARNQLAKARYDMDGIVLRAPFSGRIADVTASAWDQAPSGPFCSLIDDSSMNVKFNIMESDFGKVSKGNTVRVIPFASGDREYRGKVISVNPSVGKNGLIEVCAGVPGATGLIDGMNVKVIVDRMIPGGLVVPKSAVVIRDNLNVLFTYSDDGTAHWTYVNILDSNSESYMVEANADRGAELREGDRVIISGNLNLADGSKVSLE